MLTLKILNEKDKDVGTKILELFYGTYWKFIVERMTPRPDGLVMKFQHEGHQFRVYRQWH